MFTFLTTQEIQERLKENTSPSTDALLGWFAENRNQPILEEQKMDLGRPYYRFSTHWESRRLGKVGAWGFSFDRKTAAVKCVAESLERETLSQVDPSEIVACNELAWKDEQLLVSPIAPKAILEKSLYTSNGWAVHTTLAAALNASVHEVMERHILLYSYLKWGWNGFDKSSSTLFKDQVVIYLTARARAGEFQAGIVALPLLKTGGHSFGYFCDQGANIHQSPRLEHALFEAIDPISGCNQIGTLGGAADPISNELRWWAENRVEIAPLAPAPREVLPIPPLYTIAIDLRKNMNLGFPLYATYVFSDAAIPLFFSGALTASGRIHLEKLLKTLQIPGPIPDRHPVI